ncbi:BON domain-containing protein [Variovorax paradoxus]|nr:BON domain-containing protein [Variovorax paradoxus]MBT2300641.1 BON domain-containing protein [Variovorax paradoxus]
MIQSNPTFKRAPTWLAALMLAGGALALGGCNKGSNETAGEKLDSAVAKTERAGADAKAKTESSAAGAKEAAKDAGAAVATSVDDASITAAVSAGLAKDPDLSAIKIDVDTKGGTVMLKGPAPNAAAKSRAEEIAKNVKGVNSVDNQLEVKS